MCADDIGFHVTMLDTFLECYFLSYSCLHTLYQGEAWLPVYINLLEVRQMIAEANDIIVQNDSFILIKLCVKHFDFY